jgi:uncharacterized surface protein with fasciclin (FAS1) repeats
MLSLAKKWLLISSIVFLSACDGNDDPSVLDVARNDPQFTVLVEAVQAAGLQATLDGDGPLTVFAPTDTAFASLLAELGLTKAQLLNDTTLLTSVLTYQVLPTRVNKAAVPLGQAITAVDGGFFKIDSGAGGALTIQDGRNRSAAITATDLPARNGVVHVIDKVILPANRNILQTAQALPDFSVLVEALVAADLTDTLSAVGPFTVFAPTNAAFTDLLTSLGLTKEQLLADTVLLTSVLKYHVVSGRVLKADVPVGTPIQTLETGKTFTVDGTLVITDAQGNTAQIVTPDVFTSNGVVHVIDAVIRP